MSRVRLNNQRRQDLEDQGLNGCCEWITAPVKQAANYVADKTIQATNYVVDKGTQATSYVADKSTQAYDYTTDKVEQAFDYSVNKVEQAGNYVKEVTVDLFIAKEESNWAVNEMIDRRFGGYNKFNTAYKGWNTPGFKDQPGIKKIRAELGFQSSYDTRAGSISEAWNDKILNLDKAIIKYNKDGIRDRLAISFLLAMDYVRERRLYNAFAKKYGNTAAKNAIKGFYEIRTELRDRGMHGGLSAKMFGANKDEVVNRVAEYALTKELPKLIRDLDVKWVSQFIENYTYNNQRKIFSYKVLYGKGKDVVFARKLPVNFDDFVVHDANVYYYVKGSEKHHLWNEAVLLNDSNWKSYVNTQVANAKQGLSGNDNTYRFTKNSDGLGELIETPEHLDTGFPSALATEDYQEPEGLGVACIAIVSGVVAIIVALLGAYYSYVEHKQTTELTDQQMKALDSDTQNKVKAIKDEEFQLKKVAISKADIQQNKERLEWDELIEEIPGIKSETLYTQSKSKLDKAKKLVEKAVASESTVQQASDISIEVLKLVTISRDSRISLQKILIDRGEKSLVLLEHIKETEEYDIGNESTNNLVQLDVSKTENTASAGSFMKDLVKFDYKDKSTQEIAVDLGKKALVLGLVSGVGYAAYDMSKAVKKE